MLLTETDAGLGRRVDFRLQHLTSHRAPLHALVDALRAGDGLPGVDPAALAAIPNLRWQLDEADAPTGPTSLVPHPATPDALLPFEPVVDLHRIGEPRARDGSRPPLRKSLDTNKGCPFSAPIDENPAFDGVPMPAEGVTRAGCSFCFMGGDYKALPWRETVAIHVRQIGWYQRALTARGERLDEIVLRDQHAIRYLPHLVRALRQAELQPVGILVPGRGDAILRYADALRDAADAGEGSGFWFTLYLIGFESFSQPQLDLYNKGVRVADYAAALTDLHALHRAHPDTFRLTAYGASSFILWNPWTTLDDLRATTTFCRAHDVLPLAHGIGDTRLRLYPHLPLWHKARAEGLLQAEERGVEDAGARWTGYAAATPWLARDGRLAVAEVLATGLLRRIRPGDALDALELATAWVERRFPTALPPNSREAIEAGADVDAIALRDAIDAVLHSIDRLQARWQRTPGDARVGAAAMAPETPRGRTSADSTAAQRTVLLGGGCNNACSRCIGGHRRHDDTAERLLPMVARAAADGRVVFGGREPTLVRPLPKLLRAARAAGADDVLLVSNARALALPGVAERLARAGATRLLAKRHRLADADEDAYAHAAGAGAQQREGVRAARAAGLRVGAWLLPIAGAEAELPALVAQAVAEGAGWIVVRVMLAEVEPERAETLGAALDAAVAEAAAHGVALTLEGF
ncbi:MAG: hypothetical protein RIT45_1289 [Pseudomonadota bacterium]